jgi:hypothetical protein
VRGHLDADPVAGREQEGAVDLSDLHDLVAAGNGERDGLAHLVADAFQEGRHQPYDFGPRIVPCGVQGEERTGHEAAGVVPLEQLVPLQRSQQP